MEDYFSLDAILSSEPRVYTVFRVPGRTLAHLDPLHAAGGPAAVAADDAAAEAGDALAAGADAADANDLPAGKRVALPFWLAETLAERSFADVELPRVYSGTTRAELRADAPAVSLRARCDAYFELGVRLARLLRARHLPAALLAAYAARCWRAVDAGAHAHAPALARLDRAERALFFAARAVAAAARAWKERRSARIRTARAVLAKRPLAPAPSALGKRGPPTTSPITPRPQSRARVR